MLKRIPQKAQLDLFEGTMLYVSQADAARIFGVTSRMIQYWEAQGLLNPELPIEGRSRRYTNFDLVELRFIKMQLVDQGYTVPSLKEKLESLKPPYYYDPEDAFWDLKDKAWKSRSKFAVEQLQGVRTELEAATAEAIEQLRPMESSLIARSLLDMAREFLDGRVVMKKRRRAKKKG